MVKKYLFLIFILINCHLTASATFTFNNNCIDAYNAILSLRMTDARTLIQKEKLLNPKNGIATLLDNYVDYFSLLASDNKNDYEKLKERKSARVSLLEDNEDEKSPYYLFSQAEIYLQWGLLKGKYGDYMSSAFDIKKAKGLLEDNAEKFPDFLPNVKDLGLINVVFGSIPPNLSGISHFMGMKGNAQTGIKQLQILRTQLPKTKYSFYNDEVIFFLCYIDIDLLHNKGNYAQLTGYLSQMESKSLLRVYLQGYVAAKTAHNEEAINFLQSAPIGAPYVTLPAINYILGNAKLNRMDTDANVYLQQYIKDYKGQNYIKDTYSKLAYYYLLQNDQEKYAYYIKLVRTRGYDIDQKDKQALREANDAKPDLDLLKARFYFDGGYFDKALAEIKNKKQSGLKLLRDKIELSYRLGRIYERTDKINDALINYQDAINLGKATSYYYSANAALTMGHIYEQRKDYKKAISYYQQAVDMKNHEYQADIDNEAKEGLKRLGQ